MPRHLSLRTTLWFLLVGLAACQTRPDGPSPGLPLAGGPSPSLPLLSPGPTPQLSPAALPSPAPGTAGEVAAPAFESLVGVVLDDKGSPVEAAEVQVETSVPGLPSKVSAAGGAFGLRNVPVGAQLKLTVSAPGFTARTRSATIEPVRPGTDDLPNRLDFGGDEEGAYHALSREFEVASVQPGNLKPAPQAPFEARLRFSNALRETERGTFESMVNLRPSVEGAEGPLKTGLSFGRERLRFTWDVDGKGVAMRFALPFVARTADALLTLELAPESRDIEDWPKDVLGNRLGFAVVSQTEDGSGALVRNRVAPFAREVMPSVRPSARPSQLPLWGATHMTSVRWALRRDETPLKVVSVVAYPGSGDDPDQFLLTFSKPVYGFPESALTGAITQGTSYRFVLGRTTERKEREEFEAADPAQAGTSPTRGVTFEPSQPNQLYVKTSAGKFSRFTHFKFYISPDVQDVYGVRLGEGVTVEGRL